MSRLFHEIDKAQTEARLADHAKPRRFRFPLFIRGRRIRETEERSVPADTVQPAATVPEASSSGMARTEQSGEAFVKIPVAHSLGMGLQENREKERMNQFISRWGGGAFFLGGIIVGLVIAWQAGEKTAGPPLAEKAGGEAAVVQQAAAPAPVVPEAPGPPKSAAQSRQIPVSQVQRTVEAQKALAPGQAPATAAPSVASPEPPPPPEPAPANMSPPQVAPSYPTPEQAPPPAAAPVAPGPGAASAVASLPQAPLSRDRAAAAQPPPSAVPPVAVKAPATPAPALTGGNPPINPALPKAALEGEVRAFLLSWVDAWKKSAGPSGNMEAYMGHYSDLFSTGKMNKAAWRKDKTAKAKNKSWIDVEMQDISLRELTPGKIVEVRFAQQFKSPNFQDKSRKVLVVGKEAAGWRIVSEKTE